MPDGAASYSTAVHEPTSHFEPTFRILVRIFSMSFAHDIERQAEATALCFPRATSTMYDDRDRAGQGCFLCLESPKQGQYAVLVPCVRPTEPPQVVGFSDMLTSPKPIYGKMMFWETACESDEQIYRRLVDTCYRYLGPWKKWLPYYGIDEVEPNNVAAECERIIAKHPTGPYLDIDEVCLDDDDHSNQCLVGMDEWSQPCIRAAAEEAGQRRTRLLFPSLLRDCARDPKRANGLHTLEGWTQQSCIYDTKGKNRVALPRMNQEFHGTVRMRGLHFVLGWQKDRMRVELLPRISAAWSGFAIIWLCLVLWRATGGDWGTALAFAQVVAASLSIVIIHVQR
ncbi:hypothetical protein EV126DRAFT_412840 [Verticillium dahliae]|nr:hypothetical protein EV126DRAFT_412840 [Verticillium dahliae]